MLDYQEYEFNYFQFYLRSSLFKSYCMGIRTSRKKQLELDENHVQLRSPWLATNPYVVWGEKHEVNGIAKWISINKKMPEYILEEQYQFVYPDWYEGVNIATTPDGLADNCLIEVKCSAMGKKTYDEFPDEHYWQVYGQQMIMNLCGFNVEKTHLVNWTPKHTKIWEIQRNQEFEEYMTPLLQEYINAYVYKEELVPKPKAFQGKHKIELIYNNGDKNGKS